MRDAEKRERALERLQALARACPVEAEGAWTQARSVGRGLHHLRRTRAPTCWWSGRPGTTSSIACSSATTRGAEGRAVRGCGRARPVVRPRRDPEAGGCRVRRLGRQRPRPRGDGALAAERRADRRRSRPSGNRSRSVSVGRRGRGRGPGRRGRRGSRLWAASRPRRGRSRMRRPASSRATAVPSTSWCSAATGPSRWTSSWAAASPSGSPTRRPARCSCSRATRGHESRELRDDGSRTRARIKHITERDHPSSSDTGTRSEPRPRAARPARRGLMTQRRT